MNILQSLVEMFKKSPYLTLLFFVFSCSQPPAPIDNKSGLIFSRDIAHPVPVHAPPYSSDGIGEENLPPLGQDTEARRHELKEAKLDDAYEEASHVPVEQGEIAKTTIKEELDELPENKPAAIEKSVIVPNMGNFFKLSTPLDAKDFMWPVQGKVLMNYGQGKKGFSEGISIGGKIGDVVKASADGTVIYAEDDFDKYGRLIIIKHKNNFSTAYAHNSEILVKRNQKVIKGQAIAKLGQTGSVAEPQLYFSIRHYEALLDPEKKFSPN